MKVRLWLIPVAAGLAGFGVGVFVSRNAGEAAAAPPLAPAVALNPASTGGPPAYTLDELRRVVREELAAQRVAGTKDAGTAQQPEPPAAPDTAQTAAAARASQSLTVAIAKRAWTAEDAQALQDDFARMAPEQRVEWLQQFAVAVNQGRLIPQTDRVPF